MAFSEETVLEAWKRSNGQCECEKRSHSHFRVPCFKPLSWKARGTAVREGWEATGNPSGGDGFTIVKFSAGHLQAVENVRPKFLQRFTVDNQLYRWRYTVETGGVSFRTAVKLLSRTAKSYCR
jgi:hypothetical protein